MFQCSCVGFTCNVVEILEYSKTKARLFLDNCLVYLIVPRIVPAPSPDPFDGRIPKGITVF